MLKIVTDGIDRDDLSLVLDELVTEGARRMLLAGLEAEVADYVERHAGELDAAGRRLVVRNGRAEERTLVTGAGGLKLRAPRVHDRPRGATTRPSHRQPTVRPRPGSAPCTPARTVDESGSRKTKLSSSA
jgi:hypothetical protein